MEAHHSLEDALAAMTWRVEPGRFALLGFAAPPEPADLELVTGEGPAQLVREGGETTLLVAAERSREVVARHPDARVEGDLAWIRFDAPMAWDLVGFLARVTGALAAAGVPVGAVCGFSRDHLFVGGTWEAAARRVLTDLLGPSRG